MTIGLVLETLYYTVCLSCCSAGILTAFFRYRLKQEETDKWFMLLCTAFCLLIISLIFGALSYAFQQSRTFINSALNILSITALSINILILPLFSKHFWKHKGQSPLILFTTICGPLSVLSIGIILFPESQLVFWGAFVPFLSIFVFTVIYTLYCFISAMKQHRRGRIRISTLWVRVLGPVFRVCSVIFPLIILSDILQVPTNMFQVIVPHFTPLLAAVFGVTYIAAVFSSDYGEKNILGNVPKTEVSEDKAITTRLKQFSLSRRETEVVNLLIEGLSYQAIGDQLFISAGTAKTHILRIYRKTGVQSKLALYQLLTGTTKR